MSVIDKSSWIITDYGTMDVKYFIDTKSVGLFYRTVKSMTKEEMQQDIQNYKISILAKIREYLNVDDSILEKMKYDINLDEKGRSATLLYIE